MREGVGVGADTDGVFAQAFTSVKSGGARRLLLVNKRNGWANVSVDCGAGCTCASALVIDEDTGLQPARTDGCTVTGERGLSAEGVGIVLAPFATAVLRLM